MSVRRRELALRHAQRSWTVAALRLQIAVKSGNYGIAP
jgi:hypothetical protein